MFERTKAMSLGLLGCRGRHTISNMLVTMERHHDDWSADYRAFSRAEWDVRKLFGIPKRHVLGWIPREQPIVAALDDTKLHKTGMKIPGVSYQRDPLSPAFHTNFIRAQRFVQISVTVPLDSESASPARAFPVAFEHAPPPKKPSRQATDEERKDYKKRQQTQNLSCAGVRMMEALRNDYDELGQVARKLVFTVDGSYTNKTVLKNLPARTSIIGRIRKDAKLFSFPNTQPSLGRKRIYGAQAPTPEELRVDDLTPWQSVKAFAAGKTHDFSVKITGPLLWKKAGSDQPVRLLVIRPLSYRLTKAGRLLYRQPAFLICTDPTLTLEEIVQWYVWRWDIEVNHRDEKQLIGVGEAQVRSEKAVERVPAFAVASYSMLLVASALCYGIDANLPLIKPPKWREKSVENQVRLTTGQMLEQLRQNSLRMRWPETLSNSGHFDGKRYRNTKCPKYKPTDTAENASARN